MLPESDFIEGTYVVRNMRFPSDTKLTKTSLLRWLALSLGLLTEDESRTTLLSVMDSFLTIQLNSKRNPSIKDIAEKSGQPEKAVRYHINRLVALNLVACQNRRYFFKRDPDSNELNLVKSFRHNYKKNMETATETIEGALAEIQRVYTQG